MLHDPEKSSLPKDESLIPQNTPYCYTITGTEIRDGMPILKQNTCPFYDWDDEQPSQDCGYCHFIELGDWMDKGTSLLWDQCKECGVSMGHEVSEDDQ